MQSVFLLFTSLILCKYSCYNETPLYAKRYYFSCARIGGTKKRQILSHKTSSVLDILEHDYIEHTIKAPPPLSLSLSLSLSQICRNPLEGGSFFAKLGRPLQELCLETTDNCPQ